MDTKAALFSLLSLVFSLPCASQGNIVDVLHLPKFSKQDTFQVSRRDTVFYEGGHTHHVHYFDNNNDRRSTISFWEGGSKSFELYYEHGQLDGICYSWYENGSLWNIGFYTEGKGSSISFYPNGSIRKIENSDTTGIVGFYAEWWENGALKYEQQMDSILYKFVVQNSKGVKVIQGTRFRRYTWVGRYREWHSNGELSVEGFFKEYNLSTDLPSGDHSRENGVWKYYADSGELTKEEVWDNGVLLEKKEY
jgi:antitoxin component YwqK of YwqJK toxin-antitoxin module